MIAAWRGVFGVQDPEGSWLEFIEQAGRWPCTFSARCLWTGSGTWRLRPGREWLPAKG